jgi:hypothetical protein
VLPDALEAVVDFGLVDPTIVDLEAAAVLAVAIAVGRWVTQRALALVRPRPPWPRMA